MNRELCEKFRGDTGVRASYLFLGQAQVVFSLNSGLFNINQNASRKTINSSVLTLNHFFLIDLVRVG